MTTDSRAIQRYEDDRGLVAAEEPIGPPARRGDPIGVASRLVGLLIKLTALLILLAVLAGVVGLLGVGGRATASVGERMAAAIERGAGAMGAAIQSARDALDPAHPPRVALAYDTEFEELIRLDVGSPVGGAQSRSLAFQSVQRRENPDSPETAVYAVLRGELLVPRETKIFGLTVHSTRDPQEYYLYKGETFRIGRRLYKVNWVSLDRQQIAIAAYRDPDRVTAPLKFEVD